MSQRPDLLLDDPQSIRRLLSLTAEGVMNGTLDVPRARVLASICSIASRLLPRAAKDAASGIAPGIASLDPAAESFTEPSLADPAPAPTQHETDAESHEASPSVSAPEPLVEVPIQPCLHGHPWCPGSNHPHACRDCRVRKEQLAALANPRRGFRPAPIHTPASA